MQENAEQYQNIFQEWNKIIIEQDKDHDSEFRVVDPQVT